MNTPSEKERGAGAPAPSRVGDDDCNVAPAGSRRQRSSEEAKSGGGNGSAAGAPWRGEGLLKARIRAAVRASCNRWRDGQDHYEACLRDIWQEPRADWEWFAEYFERQAMTPRDLR